MSLTHLKKIKNLLYSKVMRRLFVLMLAVISISVAVLTYGTLVNTDLDTTDADWLSLYALLKINGILLLLLLIFLALRGVRLWNERRMGMVGAKLQARMVMIFSVLAVVPTVLITVFSLIFFDLGIDAWFSKKIRNAVKGSEDIAASYLEEHRGTMKTTALSMARDLMEVSPDILQSNEKLSAVLSVYAQSRGVTEALIFNLEGEIKARYGLTAVLELEPIPQTAIEQANQGDSVVLNGSTGNRVRALIKLDRISNVFLVVGRFIDPKIIEKAQSTTSAAVSFENLQNEREELKISFVLMFLLVALVLLVAAVLLGLIFAHRLVAPVSHLMKVTNQVALGDYHVRTALVGDDEIAQLGHAFDNMVDQLDAQRLDLIQAAQDIDRRRLFTEAILLGVGSGIISLDREGGITLSNHSSMNILGCDLSAREGEKLIDILPVFAPIMHQVGQHGSLVEDQVRLTGEQDGVILLVRATVQYQPDDKEKPLGYVLVFDDISPLLSAQRQAAWSDVARRIAHEIKNPLTPIQLSAERLRRKYTRQITSDVETFEICTDTIIRQVQDIGRLVDEFSNFARMPAAVLHVADLRDICRQSFSLEKNAHPYIQFELSLPDDPVWVAHDVHQMSQVFINLLQNAYESIESTDNISNGWIALFVTVTRLTVTVRIEDNGIGFPKIGREKLLDPYVTTREKGTGLGLSIVSKIIKDHKGKLQLLNNKQGGAVVEFNMPITKPKGTPGPGDVSKPGIISELKSGTDFRHTPLVKAKKTTIIGS